MTDPPPDKGAGERRRKAHHKSRRGCRNCKLRRVKCDETRPRCRKCTTFGVSCNYDDPTAPDLQPSYSGATIGTAIKNLPLEPARSTSPAFVSKSEVPKFLNLGLYCVSDNGNSMIPIDRESAWRLWRFFNRTVLSVGTPLFSNLYRSDITDLYPYLRHMVLAITALHDRHLASPNSRQTDIELYHASRTAAIFNKKLHEPLKADDRDPMWVTAALLGVAAVCWVDASCVEEAWPLTPPKPTDLDWIRLSKSKSVIWQLTDPLREGGRFRPMVGEFQSQYMAVRLLEDTVGFEGLPSGLTSLCEIDEQSTPHTNPYFLPLQAIAVMESIEYSSENILAVLLFLRHITGPFQTLLKKRDPRALLLLAYWYAQVLNTCWWIERRSALECKAICLYLEKYHADKPRVLELLLFPKMRCGLAD